MKLNEVMESISNRTLTMQQLHVLKNDLPDSEYGMEFNPMWNDGDFEGMADVIQQYARDAFGVEIDWDHAMDIAENFR